MLQTNWWTCRQGLSAAVLQTNFVCTGSPDRQNSADKLCLQKIRQNLAKMQTNPADKLCLQKIRQKLGQNADKSCRQTLSAKNPPKPGSKCRQILQTNLVKTENCRQLQKKCRQSLSSIVRKGLSILDKLCLYPKILELALHPTPLILTCRHWQERGKNVTPSADN